MGIYSRGFRNYSNYQPKPKYATPEGLALSNGNVDKETAVRMITFISSYTGTFQPMIDIRNTFSKKGELSESQWSLIQKSLRFEDNSNKRNAFINAFKPMIFIDSIDAVLNKTVAYNHFKKNLKLNYAVYTVKITEIVDAKPSRGGNFWKVKLKIVPNVDGVVNVCRMCGKSLTDHTSIVTGVGPYCAKRLDPAVYQAYKKDTDKFMKMFKDEVSKIGETEVECWTNALDDRSSAFIISELTKLANQQTPLPVVTKSKPVTILFTNNIEYNSKVNRFYINRQMVKSEYVQALYSQFEKTGHDTTIVLVNPKTNGKMEFNLVDTSEEGHLVYKPSSTDVELLVDI